MPQGPSTKERILNEAFGLFLAQGYDKVSMDDVAKAAGLSKGGLFHHFGSKYELARDCLVHGLTMMFGDGFHEDVGRAKTPERRVKALIDTSMDEFSANSRMLMLVLDVYAEGLKRGDDQKAWRDFYSAFVAHTEEMLRGCGVPNPKERARILLAALDGLAFQMIILEEDGKSRAVGRTKAELLRMTMQGAKVKSR